MTMHSGDGEMKEFAEEVAKLILERMGPELHRAMVEKIIVLAEDKWRWQFTSDEHITKLIDDGIERAMAEKYKPALDFIADERSRRYILRRAEKNGIPAAEILELFPTENKDSVIGAD